MTVVFVYSQRNQQATVDSYFDFVLAAFQNRGALVLEEERFLATGGSQLVPYGDRIVNFYCDKLPQVWARTQPQFRWNYAIDELATEDGRAYATKIRQCKENDSTRTVVTFVNPKHLSSLSAAGISHVGMPCCPPRVRARTSKPNPIAAFGTFHHKTYPERTRVKDILLRSAGTKMVHDRWTSPQGEKAGEEYLKMLDTYQFGLVCRAGYRDRFVNKYVEYGASHVLPVGDCPTYMPIDMKQTMLNTEGRDAAWIVAEMSRLIQNPQELSQRQEAFAEAVGKHFNILAHADRVLKTIASI